MPNNTPTSNLVSEHVEFGQKLKQKGNLEGAIAQFRKALLLDPNSEWAHHQLAVALDAKGDVDGALAEYRVGLEGSRSSFSHGRVAELLRRKGDWAGAMAEYREVLRESPHYYEVRSGLEEVLSKQREPSALASELRRILAEIVEGEKTAFDDRDGMKLGADGESTALSLITKNTFAFSSSDDGEENKYPNPCTMTEEKFKELYTKFNNFKRDWVEPFDLNPEKDLSPVQLKFYHAVEARWQKMLDDEKRKYEELAERNGTTPQEEARKSERQKWEQWQRENQLPNLRMSWSLADFVVSNIWWLLLASLVLLLVAFCRFC